jgi:hypothetical protein
MLIKDVFGIESYSPYKEPELDFMFNDSFEITPEKYIELRDDDKMWYIKTHNCPRVTDRTVYLVRNGRDAIASFAKFHGVSNKQAMLGEESRFCSWSDHVEAWQPFYRPVTHVIQYERMLEEPDRIAEQFGRFIGQRPKKPFENTLDKCHEKDPQIFNLTPTVGKFTEDEEDLFQRLHGETMKGLGYE